jgi:hypothetical protein
VTRLVAVPDWGDSGALYQHVEVPEPGDPGYPAAELPDSDPWSPAINRAIREIAAEASQAGWHPEPKLQPGITPEHAAEVRAAAGDYNSSASRSGSSSTTAPSANPRPVMPGSQSRRPNDDPARR